MQYSSMSAQQANLMVYNSAFSLRAFAHWPTVGQEDSLNAKPMVHPTSYLWGGASPHSSTAEMWGYGRCGFLSRQSVTQIEAFFMLFFPFFQTSKML